jgi:hypothetical protein
MYHCHNPIIRMVLIGRLDKRLWLPYLSTYYENTPPQSILAGSMWSGLTMTKYDESGIARVVVAVWGASPGCPGSDGGVKTVRNKVGSIYVIVCVCPDKWLINWQILRWYMAKEEIGVCWWNRACWRPLVKWSAILIDVSIHSRWIRSRVTNLQSKNVFVSMCLVCGVDLWAFPMAVHALLSSYRTVAASCGMSRFQRILRTNRIIFTASYVAMNLAFVVEPATVGWNLIL